MSGEVKKKKKTFEDIVNITEKLFFIDKNMIKYTVYILNAERVGAC